MGDRPVRRLLSEWERGKGGLVRLLLSPRPFPVGWMDGSIRLAGCSHRHHLPCRVTQTQATFGGVASLVSTSLAKAVHGYGAALWLSFVAVLSCTALIVGYHPQRGLVVKRGGRAKTGERGPARAVEM